MSKYCGPCLPHHSECMDSHTRLVTVCRDFTKWLITLDFFSKIILLLELSHWSQLTSTYLLFVIAASGMPNSALKATVYFLLKNVYSESWHTAVRYRFAEIVRHLSLSSLTLDEHFDIYLFVVVNVDYYVEIHDNRVMVTWDKCAYQHFI